MVKINFRVSSDDVEHASLPPRGWNSYDSFCWTISEEEFLQSAEIISKQLLPHGYEVQRWWIDCYLIIFNCLAVEEWRDLFNMRFINVAFFLFLLTVCGCGLSLV